MKVAGIVLACLGGLMTLGGISNAVTQYDLSSPHDLSKFLGGLGVSLMMLVAGIVMIRNAKRPA